jgi:hypothetical protein
MDEVRTCPETVITTLASYEGILANTDGCSTVLARRLFSEARGLLFQARRLLSNRQDIRFERARLQPCRKRSMKSGALQAAEKLDWRIAFDVL